MTLRLLPLSLLTALSLAGTAHACYAVYDADGRLVQVAARAPADARAATVPQGGRVVISRGACAVSTAPMVVARNADAQDAVVDAVETPTRRTPSTAPLLTNIKTAQDAQARYDVAGDGIAVVAPRDAERVWSRAPAVPNVVPATRPVADRPLVVAPRAEAGTVITEWADGRVEVQRAQPLR